MKVKPKLKEDKIIHEENQHMDENFSIKEEILDEDQEKIDEFDSFVDEVNEEVEKQEIEEILDETNETEGDPTQESSNLFDDKYFTVEKTTKPEDSESDEEPEFKHDKITVKAKFPKNATSIECLLTATGYKDRVIASGKELRLLQSRLYYIPVDTDENSDDYLYIKIMSDMSDSIDVRHIKDGYACVSALKHNVKIVDDVRIAVLS